jgi:hypothetical protein
MAASALRKVTATTLVIAADDDLIALVPHRRRGVTSRFGESHVDHATSGVQEEVADATFVQDQDRGGDDPDGPIPGPRRTVRDALFD